MIHETDGFRKGRFSAHLLLILPLIRLVYIFGYSQDLRDIILNIYKKKRNILLGGDFNLAVENLSS